MIKPQSLSERLLFNTVRIEALTRDGNTSTGTAFFFQIDLGQDKVIPLLITNKHVVANTCAGTFLVHEGETFGDQLLPSGKSIPVHLENFEQLWIKHPSDHIDLCAMLLAPLIHAASSQGKSLYYIHTDSTIIPSIQDLENLSAVESILMVGYPTGIWDTFNNLPLVRRGVTATHPAIDFNGEPISVIDMACFPGSSGSPVLIVDEGSYVSKAGTIVGGQNRIFLLGVLYAGPRINVEGEIVTEEIPTGKTTISRTSMMIHLGYIIKSKELFTLGEAVKQHLRGRGEEIP